MHASDVLVKGSLLASEDSLSNVHVFWQHCCRTMNVGQCHEIF